MSEDHRDHVRVDRVLEFEFTSQSIRARARLEDLSEGGAFVDTANPLRVGDPIEFRLTLPDAAEPLTGKAEVIWQQPTVGMGIKFVGLTEEQREQIRFYVAAEFFKSFQDR